MSRPTLPALPTDDQIVDAYLYLFGRLLVARQEKYDIEVEKVGWNTIKYNPLGSAEFVNPNLDVAYLEAWIAVDPHHAVTLDVPEITGRYYTVQIMDVWGEVIANVNERNYPTHPFGQGRIPAGRVHPARRRRRAGHRPPRPQGQDPRPRRAEGHPRRSGRAAEAVHDPRPRRHPTSHPRRPSPRSRTPQLPGVDAFRVGPQLLETAPDAMPDAPRYAALVSAVAAHVATGDEAAASVDRVIRTQAWPAFLAGTKGFGTQRNGWSVAFAAGRFGNDVLARDIVDYGGLWANIIDEAIYYVGQLGSDDELLDGSRTYEIRFAKGEPDGLVRAFWSLTLYSVPDYRVVPNPINRYNISSEASLTPNDDGTTSIWLAPEQPALAHEPNWLPTPAGKGFSLNLRLYVAREPALRGDWFPPSISVSNA